MDITDSLATSRLIAQSHAMAVIANNLANADTPGFQEQRIQFAAVLTRQPGARPPPGGQTLAYTEDRATWRETTPGPLQHTGNPLDLAITGKGYFTVMTKAGPRLTRDGRFGLLADGTVADAAGNALLDTTGKPIRLGAKDTGISVASDGTLSAGGRQVAQVGVVVPTNPMQLRAQGGSLFVAGTPTKPATSPGIVQGAVEGSNVQPLLELTDMINTSRQFEFMTRFIQAESQRKSSVIDKLLPTPGNLP
jgi:flagellar basal-body rod protein FlgF